MIQPPKSRLQDQRQQNQVPETSMKSNFRINQFIADGTNTIMGVASTLEKTSGVTHAERGTAR